MSSNHHTENLLTEKRQDIMIQAHSGRYRVHILVQVGNYSNYSTPKLGNPVKEQCWGSDRVWTGSDL
jgi:hypothetical protein